MKTITRIEAYVPNKEMPLGEAPPFIDKMYLLSVSKFVRIWYNDGEYQYKGDGMRLISEDGEWSHQTVDGIVPIDKRASIFIHFTEKWRTGDISRNVQLFLPEDDPKEAAIKAYKGL